MVTRSCTLDRSLRSSIPNPCAVTTGQVVVGVHEASFPLSCLYHTRLEVEFEYTTRRAARPGALTRVPVHALH